MRFFPAIIFALVAVAVRGERWHATLMAEKRHPALLMMLFDRSSRLPREGRYVLGRQVEGSGTEPAGEPTPVPVEFKPLQKSRKIAGVECLDHAFEAAGRRLQGCFTKALGRFWSPIHGSA